MVAALEALVEPTARGDPMSPLRWTCKSTRRLATELRCQGHPISHTKVAQLLEQLGYSLQGTRKVREGASYPDRNTQFAYINQGSVLDVDTRLHNHLIMFNFIRYISTSVALPLTSK